MSNEKASPKIGAGHARAMFRVGLNELRNALYADSNVAQRHAEQGLAGTVTQSEVREQKQQDLQPQREQPPHSEPERSHRPEPAVTPPEREAPDMEP